ncbi:DUF2294 domain-containing protein [bacterium]|nr:DUF2294 domain-containing protein [bacterium]
MKEYKAKLEDKVSRLVHEFQSQQLGERASSVKTVLFGDVLSILARDCLSRGERDFVADDSNWRLLQENKSRAFEMVKDKLVSKLEDALGCKITNVYSVIDKSGIRFELVILNENLEKELSG